MVRETRHLWIGNLPENVREEEIRDLFQRHGRVQSVKLQSEEHSGNNGGPGRTAKSATVAFIDVRSATKALRSVRSIAGQPIHINYHEPGSVSSRCPPPPLEPRAQGNPPSNLPDAPVIPQGNLNQNVPVGGPGVLNNCIPSSPGMYRQQRFAGQHGPSDDASSHFYDQPKSFSRGRGDGHGFHGRGRRDTRPPFHNRHSFPADNRNFRPQWSYPNEGRYAPPAHSEVDERPPVPPSTPHPHPPVSEASSKGSRRPESPASSVSSRHVPNKRHRSRSVSESGSSDRGSTVGSRSRSGSRSSVSTSVSSRSRSPPHHASAGHFPRGGASSGRFHPNSFSRQRYNRSRVVSRSSDSRVRHSSRSPLAASPSSSATSSPSPPPHPHRKIAAPHSPTPSPTSSSKSYSPSRNIGGSHHHHHNHHHHHRTRTPNNAELHAAIKIRDLPIRSSDTSLKDGLYHEYKKHGKVAWVRVIGSGPERYAIVCFKTAEHAARAVQLSGDKQFFGCKIHVSPFNHGKGDENVGLQEDENRVVGEEEPASVGYPTRTVLITGLDAAVTQTELKSAFDQYGDIVQIDIRKHGTATHAVCEFVDIASAIRAQWGRHVFKSREARISFYRNPASTSLLLDGTAGVNDKEVRGYCCQYGAIKNIVMDPERVLALVQFEEISSAQNAIRQLRGWVIKGKHLQVDFASVEVIRRFLERVSTGILSTAESSSPSLHGVSSPSIGNSIVSTKDGGTAIRRFRNRVEEEDPIYRRSQDFDGFKFKSIKGLARTLSCEGGSIRDFTSDGEVYPKEKDGQSRLRSGYTSPVSPDPEHSITERLGLGDSTSAKCNSRSKIDLNCHETDSAIVTSSSDVIVGEKSESHTNHGSSSSSLNGDEKLSSLELCGTRRKSVAGDISHSAIVTVDGVSSTSPEPKTETVRKASPDPGIGIVEQNSRFSGETRFMSGGLIDPRRNLHDCKIRRSSADSGNSSGVVSSHMHSTSGAASSYSSLPQLQASTTVININVDGNDSDDRPGTPLCDENPECFASSPVLSSIKPSHPQPFSMNVKSDPANLAVTEFALPRQRANSNTSAKEFPSSSVRISRSSSETNLQSPTKSPTSSGIDVLTSASVPILKSLVSEFDVISSLKHNSSFSLNSITGWRDDSTQIIDTNDSSLCNLDRQIIDSKSKEMKTASSPKEIDNQERDSLSEPRSDSRQDSTSLGLSDSEAESPLQSSPSSATLDQRIQKCCETYDLWNGNRANLNSNQVLHPGNTRANSVSADDVNAVESIGLKKPCHNEFTGENSSPSRFPLTKHKFLDLEELRHQPSDIGRTVLARRSVFDEDSKRLENYEEKYEAKTAGSSVACSTWRAMVLQRSTSTASTSSTNSISSLLPTVSSPLTPPAAGIPNPNPNYINSSLQSPLRVNTPSALGSVSSGNANTPTRNSCPQGVFQGNNASQQKPKDLTVNQTQGIVCKPLKIDPVSRIHTNPSPNTQTPLQTASQSQQRQSVSSQSSVDESKSPLMLKLPEKLDNVRQMPSPKLVANILPPSPYPTHSQVQTQVVSGPNISSNSSAPPPMVHQGLPRAVERSLSLDSKKAASGSGSNTGTSWNPSGSSNHAQPNVTVGNGSHSLFSNPLDISTSIGNNTRRSSVDSHANTGTSKSNCETITSHPQSTEKHEQSVKKVKDSNAIHSKSATASNKNTDKGTLTLTNASSKTVCTSDKALRPTTSSTVSQTNSKKQHAQKSDFIKEEVMEIRPIHQETTVAVVATEQNPFIPVRSDSVGASTTKEGSKKEKDKKRRSSGSSTSVNTTTPYLNPSRIDDSVTQQSSSRERISSVKASEDRKEKKEKHKSTGDTNSKSNEGSKPEAPSNSSCHIKNDEKKEKKKKESHKEKDPTEHTSLAWKESHGHRKDKESAGKRKRRLSSQEVDAGGKRPKVEKDSCASAHHESSHHHRLKSTSSNERRESRDSSCSSKDKLKEKETSRTSSVISQSSDVSSNRDKDHQEIKTKENHHRSKDKSSTGTSKDKHQTHQNEKPRTPSESRSNHLSSKVGHHSGKDKDRQKNDKVSVGKENLKGHGKHHSHSGSHHGECSSKSKDNSNLPKTKISSKERTKSQGEKEKRHSVIDSESESGSTHLQNHSGSGDIASHADLQIYERLKSEKHEKKDSNGKRDRHRSGGDNPSTSGGSDKAKSSEQRRKKKYVIDDTESSDSPSDDEEKKKHHSIFEVVIDEYVSMYDKVKARSNRACKSQTTPVQNDEVKNKQDKIKDQLQQLKQSSRAKKIDKKRSTSVDDSNNKSIGHTSSDEGSQMEMSMADFNENHQDAKELFSNSSDAEDFIDLLAKAKSPRKLKDKKKSSSSEKLNKKRGRKNNKASPSGNTLFQVSASSIFSNSDYESNCSSSHRHEPQRKKKRLSVKSSSASEKIPTSFDIKSSDESGSESDATSVRKPRHPMKPKSPTKTKASVVDNQSQKKLQANDVYSDSDSSVQSGPLTLVQKPIISNKLKNKEKLSRQKSMRKSLFESSDSSDAEIKRSVQDIRKEKIREPTGVKKDKESKSNRKKHRGHSSSTSISNKSLKASKKQRISSGDGSFEPPSTKRESGSTMEDLLFGPMTSSSSSDIEDNRHQDLERPKTPTVVTETKLPTPDDVVVRKLSKTRSTERKASRSLSPCSSVDMGLDHMERLLDSMEKGDKQHSFVPFSKLLSSNSEKIKPISGSLEKIKPIPSNLEKVKPISSNLEKIKPITGNLEKSKQFSSICEKSKPIAANSDKIKPISGHSEKNKTISGHVEKSKSIVGNTEKNKPISVNEKTKPISGNAEKVKSIPVNSEKVKSIPVNSEKIKSIPAISEKIKSIPVISEKIKPIHFNSEKIKPLATNPEKIKSIPLSCEKIKPMSGASEKIKAISTNPEKMKLVSGNSEKLKPICTNSEKNKPMSAIAEKIKPVLANAEKNKPTSGHSEKNKLISVNSEKEKPISGNSEKSKSVSGNSEKKKKKHHKEKRTKRQEGEEPPRSTKITLADAKPVDYDSLFNSPKHSPVTECDIKPASPAPLIKEEPILNIDTSASVLFTSESSQSEIKMHLPLKKIAELDEIEAPKASQENQLSGMFSSDDDDDDDKLKIDINIIASSDEPGMDSVMDGTEDGNFREKLQREEEEKKLHSLFEQDKAIQSIVQLERKSSPPPSTVPDDEVIKDEIPKDCPTISQEETEDAVAALLVTLEGDDDADEATNPAKVSVSNVVPKPILSPPTLRIIEESTPVLEMSSVNTETETERVSSNIQVCIDRVAQSEKESVAWTFDSGIKSPVVPSTPSREGSPPNDTGGKGMDVNNKMEIEIPKTPDIPSRKTSVDSNAGSVGERSEESKKPARRASSQVKSRQGSSEFDQDAVGNTSADVYEFHDSDEEKHGRQTQLVHARQTPPVPTTTAKSPLTSPSLPASSVPIIEAEVIPPPTRTQSPSVPSLTTSLVTQPTTQILPVVPVVPVVSAEIPKTETPSETCTTTAPIKIPARTPTPPLPILVSATPLPLPAPAPVAAVPTSIVKTPPPAVVARNTVDETIENVIRMAQMAPSLSDTDVPALTITSVKATGPARSRSKSKDSVEENSTVSITKVMSRPENPPRSADILHPVTTLTQMSISYSNNNKPRPEKEDSVPGKEGNGEGGAGLETLIDPQTGILMPMMRQSDEGQYVPIVGEENTVLPKLQQPQFSIPSFQTKHEEPSKGTEREANRPSSVERNSLPSSSIDRTALQQPSSIECRSALPPSSIDRGTIPQAYISAPIQKNEGLAGMFSQRVMLQTHSPQNNPYSTAQNVTVSKCIPQVRMNLPPSSIQHGQIVTTIEGPIIKNSNVVFTSSGMFQTHKSSGVVTSSGASGPTIGSVMNLSSQPPFTSLSDTIPHGGIPVSHPGGVVPMSRTVFSTTQQPTNNMQQSHYQYAVISRQSEGMPPRPVMRQVSMPTAQPTHPNVSKAMPQPSGGQVQPELVNFQIPSATTITKVNSGQEESVQRKPGTMAHHAVLLSSPMNSHINMGPTGPVRAVATSPSPSLSMTHQQHQQHQQQTELFRRSAEGLIRVGTKDDSSSNPHINRSQQDGSVLAQPPRVDITGSIAQAAAASPKAGRVPLTHEQIPAGSQSRIAHLSSPYDSTPMSGDIRNVLSHARSPADSPHYGPPQSHHQVYHSPHYLQGGGPNVGNSVPQTPGYSIRPGMLDKTAQPDFKTMSLDMKGNPNLMGAERGRGQQNLPAHSMPHLQSPHPNDQRNSDSPMVTSMYGAQRHMYPTPAHQPRPTYRILYSDPVERQVSNSPSYTNSYTAAAAVGAAASEGDAGRVSSPYNTPEMGISRRGYSPPTHGRYSGSPAIPATETQSSNERQRPRQVQTPPSSQAASQDSLLTLLQKYPIMWQGLLALKNDSAACQMHFVSGNVGVARDSLPSNPDGSIPPLRISQRMRLEQTQLEGVARKMQLEAEHCILLALPCGRDHMDVLQHSNNLRTGFITYLQLKQAAGIVNICHPVSQQPAFVIHIFPSCDFANENLARIAPDLLHGVADIAHLLIVIATV